MAASQNNLTLVVNQQDVNGVNILNRVIGAIAYSGAVGQFNDMNFPTTGATTITFPGGLTNALQLYFKNTHVSANITLNWTPLAATGSVVCTKLSPGSAVVLWNSVSGNGFSALTGTADTVGATAEFFIGG